MLTRIVAALALAGPSLADDLWVDPVQGSDLNGGTSATDALATITRALAVLGPAGDGIPDNVFLLPGTYDAASGEVFPLAPTPQLEIIGRRGPEVTVIRGTGNLRLIDVEPYVGLFMRGVTIRDAYRGIEGFGAGATVELTDVVLTECFIGLHVDVTSFFGSYAVQLDRCGFSGCSIGAQIEGTDILQGVLTVSDCAFQACASRGLFLEPRDDSVVQTWIERSSFTGCWTGLHFNSLAQTAPTLFLRDSLVTDCSANGLLLRNTDLRMQRCTVTSCSQFGIVSQVYPFQQTVTGSIVWGNAVDLQSAAGWNIDFSNTAIPSFAGVDGNVSIDPVFRDAVAGDYRIGFGTPCVDGGLPFTGVELVGNDRLIDGDLDLGQVTDMGALELLPLDGPSAVDPGGSVVLEVHGELDEWSLVRLSRSGLLATAGATPFGDLWLDTVRMEDVGAVRTLGAGGPATIGFTVPASPALLGLTVGFQALTRSSVAPAGAAWTAPITLEIRAP